MITLNNAILPPTDQSAPPLPITRPPPITPPAPKSTTKQQKSNGSADDYSTSAVPASLRQNSLYLNGTMERANEYTRVSATNGSPSCKSNGKQMEMSKDSITSVWNVDDTNSIPSLFTTSITDNNNESNQRHSNLIRETKSYVLDYVIDTNPSLYSKVSDSAAVTLNGTGTGTGAGQRCVTARKQKLSIQEAKKRGILNVEKGLYVDVASNKSIAIDQAIQLGLIGARVAVHEKNLLVSPPSSHSDSNNYDEKRKKKCFSNLAANKHRVQSHETSTLTIESVLDARTGISYSISDAIKLNILDQSNLSVRNTLTGQIMTLNDAFVNGFAKGTLYENNVGCGNGVVGNGSGISDLNLNSNMPSSSSSITSGSKSNAESSSSSSSLLAANESSTHLNPHVVFSKSTNPPQTSLIEREEKSLRIETVLNTISNEWITLEQAIEHGLFDQNKGLYINPKSGKKMNLNDAFCNGFIYCTEIPEEKSSILKIDVNSPKQSSQSQPQTQSLLYEVHESHETNYPSQEESDQNDDFEPLNVENERIEQIIDETEDHDQDENEDYDELLTELPNPNQPTQSSFPEQNIRRRKTSSGLRQHILERRIPSIYGSESQISSETLIIDDVRQSAMLDIDGVTHVFKNEVLIDSDLSARASNIPSAEANRSSMSSENTCSSSSSESSSSVMSSLHLKKKTSNRSAIVVDDQIINGTKRDTSNDFKKQHQHPSDTSMLTVSRKFEGNKTKNLFRIGKFEELIFRSL